MVVIAKRYDLYDNRILWIGSNFGKIIPKRDKPYVRHMKHQEDLRNETGIIKHHRDEKFTERFNRKTSLLHQKINDNRNYYNLRMNGYKVKYFTHSKEFSIQDNLGRERTKLYFKISK